MGALGVLGQLAGGYEQAAQIEKQRQFTTEMDRRSQIGDFLKTLATNPNLRQEALPLLTQEYFNVQHAPWDKSYKLDVNKLLVPPQTQSVTPPTTPDTSMTGAALAPGAQAPPAQNVGPLPTLPPPMPPVTAPPMSNSIATAGVGAAQHTTPGGLFYTPEEAGARQAAQAAPVLAAQTQVPIEVRQDIIKRFIDANPSIDQMHAAMFISAMEGKGIPYGMMFKFHPVTVQDPKNPQGAGIPAMQNEMTKEVVDQNGDVIPDAHVFSAFMLPKKTESVKTDAAGLQTKSSSTATRGTGTIAPPVKPGGSGNTSKIPPAVSASMDQITTYGVPDRALKPAEQLAMAELKKQGINPSVAATAGARGQADSGRMILPLIQKARDLIAANPDALGPLSGRWSELQKKWGSLSGPTKELAGTLISIYSMSGSLHKWRSVQVADEFRKEYGDLSSNPDSLNSGLNAIENTASNVVKVGYPGGTQVGSSSAPHPGTHVFDSAAWKAVNKNGDVEAAKAYAKSKGYEVH